MRYSGEIFNVSFGNNTVGSELNQVHFAVLFSMPTKNKFVLCVPLTSPKVKYFNKAEHFDNRNHRELKKNLYYIPSTDSIALVDQIKSISIDRIRNSMKRDGKEVTLTPSEKTGIVNFIETFLKKTFK